MGTDAEQMIDIALNAKNKTVVEGYSALPTIFVAFNLFDLERGMARVLK